jgi:dihydrofolate reductase
MSGETRFHFVTDGIQAALQRATDAAKGRDVRLGGGVATIQQYMRARLVDEMHVTISPVLLGSGERLFADVDAPKLGYQCVAHVATPGPTHLTIAKRG